MEISVRLLYNFAIPPPKNPKIVMGKLPAWKHYITKLRKSECEETSLKDKTAVLYFWHLAVFLQKPCGIVKVADERAV